jgi:hypothetical protein
MSAPPGFLVDVVMPAHNAVGTLERALLSVFQQTHAPQRVIVVADRCSDGTVDLARELGAEVLEVHYGRASLARNAGVAAATAPWVAFLDADDRWFPQWLKSAAQIVDGNVDGKGDGKAVGDLLFCTFEEVDAAGKLIRKSPGPPVEGDHDAATSLLLECFIQTSATIVSRQAFDRLGGFSPRFEIAEDLHLWLRFAAEGQITQVPGRNVQYVRHAKSLTRSRLHFAQAVKDGVAVIDDICGRYSMPAFACQRARVRIYRDSALRWLSVGQRRAALGDVRRGLAIAPLDRELLALSVIAALPGPWPSMARDARRAWRRWRQVRSGT